MKLKPNDFRKIVVGSFLAVPALSSLISTIHIVTFFGLGNMSWMSIILALAFEIGSIASLMTLAVLDKVNRFAVWLIFLLLVIMQMLGNVYYTYDFITKSMMSNPEWINSFIDLVEMMTMQKLEPRMSKFILSLLIGLPIPIISLAFLKSVSDYLKPEPKVEEVKIDTEPKEEIVNNIEETKEEDEIVEEIVEKKENEETIQDFTPFIKVGNIIVQPSETIEEETEIVSENSLEEQIEDVEETIEPISESIGETEDIYEQEVISKEETKEDLIIEESTEGDSKDEEDEKKN